MCPTKQIDEETAKLNSLEMDYDYLLDTHSAIITPSARREINECMMAIEAQKMRIERLKKN